jgi:hypothetical protein
MAADLSHFKVESHEKQGGSKYGIFCQCLPLQCQFIKPPVLFSGHTSLSKNSNRCIGISKTNSVILIFIFVFAMMKTGKENSYVERDRKADGEKEVICLDSINSQRHLEKIVDFSLLQTIGRGAT